MHFIYPAAAMVFYIFALGILNFRTRFKGVRSGELKVDYFKTLDMQKYEVPEFVVRMGRHYNNQFELPPLFLITCMACAQTGLTHPVASFAAWGFVLSRMGHSFYHLGSNHIGKRSAWFFGGWICVLVMWGILLLKL